MTLFSHFHTATFISASYHRRDREADAPLTDMRVLSSVNVTVIDDVYISLRRPILHDMDVNLRHVNDVLCNDTLTV